MLHVEVVNGVPVHTHFHTIVDTVKMYFFSVKEWVSQSKIIKFAVILRFEFDYLCVSSPRTANLRPLLQQDRIITMTGFSTVEYIYLILRKYPRKWHFKKQRILKNVLL